MTQKTAIPTPDVTGGNVTELEGVKNVASGGAGGFEFDPIAIFSHADFVGQLVILMLIFASFWCWMIVFDKWTRFRTVGARMKKFEAGIWSGEVSLERRYEQIKNDAGHPLSRVFIAGMQEWLRLKGRIKPAGANYFGQENVKMIEKDESSSQMIRERVLRAMDTIRNREMSSLESNLGVLATVGSTAPFVGLFGTVWGIMHSFGAIASMKNTSLAVVAPGLAEALFATAIGLFAAIPAVIFYNYFGNTLAQFADKLDRFIDEFGAFITYELDE